MVEPASPPLFELRPLGIVESADYAFKLYRRLFPLIMPLTAIVLLPVLIPGAFAGTVLVSFLTWPAVDELWLFGVDWTGILLWTPTQNLLAGAVVLVWLIASVVGIGALISAITRAAADLWAGQTPTRSAMAAAAHESCWRSSGIVALRLVAAILTLVLLPGLNWYGGLGDSATFLYFSVFVLTPLAMAITVYAVRFLVIINLGESVIVIERRGTREAITRSHTLMRGNFWRVAAESLLLLVLMWIGMNITVQIGHRLVSSVLPRYDEWLRIFFPCLVHLFAFPLPIIQRVLLYFDCRIRNEHYDLEFLASPEAISGEA